MTVNDIKHILEEELRMLQALIAHGYNTGQDGGVWMERLLDDQKELLKRLACREQSEQAMDELVKQAQEDNLGYRE